MSIKTGKAKFGGEYTKRKYWKLKDGEATFRILPPLGFNGKEPSDRWSQFWAVHYGYKNSQGQMRVFSSPLVTNWKTKMVESPDAAVERIQMLQAKHKEAKSKGDEGTAKKISELLQKYNLDKNHYVNAIDEQGNIGILKLRSRAKAALEDTIKSLRDQGIEPLDVESGRFFTFRRSGTGLETTFQVTVKKRKLKIDGVGEVEQDIVHVLTDDILGRLEKEAAELDKLYKRPSSAEVERIVKESDLLSGISRAVDEIIDAKKDGGNSNDDGSDEEYGEDNSSSSAPSAAAASPDPAASATPVNVATSSPQQTAQIVATAQNTTAPTGTTQSLSTSGAPKTTAESIAETSDAEFLKSLGLDL